MLLINDCLKQQPTNSYYARSPSLHRFDSFALRQAGETLEVVAAEFFKARCSFSMPIQRRQKHYRGDYLTLVSLKEKA